MKVARFVAASAIALACNAEAADPLFGAGCGSIQTTNQTPKWAWITIYDVGQTIHLDYGWVGPFATRSWRSGHYSCLGVYHVRGEVKDAGGTSPPGNNVKTIFDTRVRIDTGNNHDAYLQMPISAALRDTDPAHWIYKGPPWQFWWSLSKDPAKVDLWGELPKFIFTNTEKVPVFVRVAGSGDDASQCLQPGAANVQVVMKNAGPHTISWKTGRCDASGPTGSVQMKIGYQRVNVNVPVPR